MIVRGDHPAGKGKPRLKRPEELNVKKVVDYRKVATKIAEEALRWSILGGLFVGVVACDSIRQKELNNKEFIEDPRLETLKDEYNVMDYITKHAVVNNEATKLYESKYVYFVFDKDDYSSEKYLDAVVPACGAEFIYDLETENLLAYIDLLPWDTVSNINDDYFENLTEENYEVHLTDAPNYVEGLEVKDYYSLEEIKELEDQVREGVKVLNRVK